MVFRTSLFGILALAALASEARAQDETELAPLPAAPAPDRPTAPARVVPPGYVPDAVFLKGGGLVRGALVESLPGDHVTIALPTGDVRRIPWSEVDHVTATATPPSAAAPVPAPLPPKRGPLVRVHLSTDQNVLLDRRPDGTDTWVPACAAPCDEDLPLGDEYRLAGAGMRSTSEFRLQGAPGGHVDVAVSPATKTAWWVGAGVGGMGLVIDGYALYIALLGSVMARASCYPSDSYYRGNCEDSHNAGTTMRNVGLVMLIPGTAAAIVGGAMMVANWRTGVHQTATGGSGTDASIKPLDAFKRSAEFKGTQGAMPGAAPTLWVPIASGTF